MKKARTKPSPTDEKAETSKRRRAMRVILWTAVTMTVSLKVTTSGVVFEEANLFRWFLLDRREENYMSNK